MVISLECSVMRADDLIGRRRSSANLNTELGLLERSLAAPTLRQRREYSADFRQ